MPQAGDTITVPTVPGSRIATEIITADSAGSSGARIEIAAIDAPVVAGRTYKVALNSACSGDAASADQRGQFDTVEDTDAGNVLQRAIVAVLSNSTNGYRFHSEAEYTADVTETKTFVIALDRFGSGEVFMAAGATNPTFLYVEYIRG